MTAYALDNKVAVVTGAGRHWGNGRLGNGCLVTHIAVTAPTIIMSRR